MKLDFSVIGTLLVGITVLSTLCATLIKHQIRHARRKSIDTTLEPTRTLKAIRKQVGAFPMLQVDTAPYLQSVKALSKRGRF